VRRDGDSVSEPRGETLESEARVDPGGVCAGEFGAGGRGGWGERRVGEGDGGGKIFRPFFSLCTLHVDNIIICALVLASPKRKRRKIEVEKETSLSTNSFKRNSVKLNDNVETPV
jgi:hypothetical protein